MEELRITDPHDLPRIFDWIHDQYFDVERNAFDQERSLLTIAFLWADYANAKPLWNFWILSKCAVPAYQAFLHFHHVEDWQLRGTERNGFYSFNVLRHEPSSRRLSVIVNEKLDFQATLRQLEISLKRTDSTVDPAKVV